MCFGWLSERGTQTTDGVRQITLSSSLRLLLLVSAGGCETSDERLWLRSARSNLRSGDADVRWWNTNKHNISHTWAHQTTHKQPYNCKLKFGHVLHWDAVHFLFPGRLYGTIYQLNFVSLTLILCSADDSNLTCLNLLSTKILLHHCSVFNCTMVHYKFPSWWWWWWLLLLLLYPVWQQQKISPQIPTLHYHYCEWNSVTG